MHGMLHARHRNRPRVFQGRASRVYDVVARRLLRRAYRRYAEDIAAAAPEGGSVLDAGTGPGVLLTELARMRPDLTLAGVDLSPDMVTAAGRNLEQFGDRVSVRHGDVAKLPYPDQSFDLIVSSLSLHHWDHPEAAAPELARVLRPGGRVYIFDFRFAPFTELIAAAEGTALAGGAPPRQTLMRTGVPLFPKVVRCVLSTGPAAGADRPQATSG
jgi:ubiquinone/menaquinone biosynthesis C-methylase UbiE